jgi:hypothetical protein
LEADHRPAEPVVDRLLVAPVADRLPAVLLVLLQEA